MGCACCVLCAAVRCVAGRRVTIATSFCDSELIIWFFGPSVPSCPLYSTGTRRNDKAVSQLSRARTARVSNIKTRGARAMTFSTAVSAWSPPLPRHHRLFRGGNGSAGTSDSTALVVDWDVERKNQRRQVRRGKRPTTTTTTTTTTTRCWRRAPTAFAASADDDDDEVGPLVKEHVQDRDLETVAAEAWAATVIVAPYVTGISKLMARMALVRQPSSSSHLSTSMPVRTTRTGSFSFIHSTNLSMSVVSMSVVTRRAGLRQ